ncbi:MAG: Glu-tRNA(Gln) amidotransferase subunit GatD [Nanohaloarchaea archaeon]|nr:Glu-tRNA(Gln) amidotransferase subunit GatD [Candidatus Nanohaloarchaea archaeon]
MYSDEIHDLLEEKDIEKGDLVKVNGREGRLMPKPESGDPDSIVLKLASGYNIGLEPEEIELVEERESKEVEKPEVPHSEDKPDILVLHTGGTIASRVSYEEGGVKPAFDPEDLVEMYPELAEKCNIYSELVAQMLSENMEPEHWQEIARKIDEVKDEYDGIIVGHGTDTMSYTGAALSLMLNNIDTGVILVGSQRSSDRPSTDAVMNLHCAADFLIETGFKGVGICMHSSSSDTNCKIMNAAKIRKMHTSKRDAFEPINSEPLGIVNYEEDEIQKNFETKRSEYNPQFDLTTDVGLLKVRPGMKPEELEFMIEQDYGGVIIEGTGLGHMPVDSFDEKTSHHKKILNKLEELADQSLVAMSSQCINGRTDMNVYSAGIKIQEAGIIEAGDMHPELAYVKLMWSLANSESMEEAKELFQTDINGEINRRSTFNG